MRFKIGLLLVVPCAVAANLPTFTYTAPPGTKVGAIAVDASGNTYFTGSTSSSTFPTTPGALQTQFTSGTCTVFDTPAGPLTSPCTDAFVIKLDPSGNTLFSTYLGGTGSQTSGSAICVDGDGNIYVGGATSPGTHDGFPNVVDTFPVTPGAAFMNLSTSGAFVAKLNAAGSQLIYSTLLPLFPEYTNFYPLAMAIDSSGNAYIASTTEFPNENPFPTTPGTFQSAAQNSSVPGIVAKLNATGSALLYATYLSGNLWDIPQGIAVDAAGDAFITGYTGSRNFPVTPGAYQTEFPSPEYAGFVTELNPQGTGLVYSTFLGVSSDSGPWAVKVDGQGEAWILGQGIFASTGVFRTGGNQSSVTHLSADGASMKFSTVLPVATALDLDSIGNAYVAGTVGSPSGCSTNSSCIPAGAAAFQTAYAGTGDAYAARFDPSGTLTGATYLGGSQSDIASLIAVAPNGSVVISGITLSPDFPGINPSPISGQAPGTAFITSMFMDLTVINAASYVAGSVSPGEIVAIKGYQLGPIVGQPLTPSSTGSTECMALQPICFGGDTFNGFGGFGAPVFYRQNQQINVQVPWELAGKSSTQIFLTPSFIFQPMPITVTSGPFYAVPVVAAVPGILSVNNSDTTRNSATNPAKPGDFITIYGTGGGLTDPMGITGAYWPLTTAEPRLTLRTSVTIGGEDASVLYAGASPLNSSGVFQINMLVPLDLPQSATASLNLTIGNASSPPVSIAIGVR